jgi:hypothetical protein
MEREFFGCECIRDLPSAQDGYAPTVVAQLFLGSSTPMRSTITLVALPASAWPHHREHFQEDLASRNLVILPGGAREHPSRRIVVWSKAG